MAEWLYGRRWFWVMFALFFSSRRRHTRSVSAFLLNRSSDLRSQSYILTLVGVYAPHIMAQRGKGIRSEERREGKSVDLGGRRIIKKTQTPTPQHPIIIHPPRSPDHSHPSSRVAS